MSFGQPVLPDQGLKTCSSFRFFGAGAVLCRSTQACTMLLDLVDQGSRYLWALGRTLDLIDIAQDRNGTESDRGCDALSPHATTITSTSPGRLFVTSWCGTTRRFPPSRSPESFASHPVRQNTMYALVSLVLAHRPGHFVLRPAQGVWAVGSAGPGNRPARICLNQ